jgi:hypothetical protein
MKTILLSILLCASLYNFTFAQESNQEVDEVFIPKVSFGIDMGIGIPIGRFQENLNSVSFGGGGHILVRTNPKSEIPVFMGIYGGISIYDSESRNQFLIIDGFNVNARVATRNNIFIGNGVVRILPPVNFPIQPYFDGLFGFKNLFTRTTIEDLDVGGDDDTIDSYIEQGDWAFSFGGALGGQILIGGNEEIFILLDFKCTYLLGEAADYLVRNNDPNIQIVDPIDAFEERNSTTNLLLPQIGVSFLF